MKLLSKLIILLFFIQACQTDFSNNLVLWYSTPAKDWMTEALPIGNGYMGAMFYGGINEEQIQVSEGSLWSGGPGSGEEYNFGIRKGAWKYLPQIRKFIKEGRYKEADQLVEQHLTGTIHNQRDSARYGDFGSQQTMGDLFIRIKHKGIVENYRRELDLTRAEGKVTYYLKGEKYKRTFWGSYPDKLMTYRFESSCQTDYQINFVSPHKKIYESFYENIYSYQGKVTDNSLDFETCFKIETDGQVTFNEGTIYVARAKDIVIYHIASTAYKNKYPDYRGNDFFNANKSTLRNIKKLSYKQLLQNHLIDYQRLYNRVRLHLGNDSNCMNTVPTDKRLNLYASGTEDHGLLELYFQYARYLMISASRSGTMPLHLQGKWNNSTDPTWACDYHTNINLQMLYWPAEITNLGECHLPLFDYMRGLVIPGKESAKEFFNTRGWVVNTMNNQFGYTSPGWGLPWGYFPAGAAWLCRHVWEHYEFSQDTVFLRETAYPLMKEAALFWMDYLTEEESGFLVSTPSYSPEHGGISGGTSMDHQIAWDLLSNCVKACQVLGVDKNFEADATQVRDKIYPLTIGSWGQLCEWKEDIDDPDDRHRHVSQLYALYPGQQILALKKPELIKAAKVSLQARGDGGTGWSLAWKVNFWARLNDGDHALKLLKRLLKPVHKKGTDYMDSGGSYPNLLCSHPPFQLDGNMGGSAGIAEMLLQSHEEDIIMLLPALPDAWAKGAITGLKARGNIEIDIYWRDHQLERAVLRPKYGRNVNIHYKDQMVPVNLKEGEEFTFRYR